MTVATTANNVSKNGQGPAAIDRKDQTRATLGRLLDYMVGGDQRSKFYLGIACALSPYSA